MTASAVLLLLSAAIHIRNLSVQAGFQKAVGKGPRVAPHGLVRPSSKSVDPPSFLLFQIRILGDRPFGQRMLEEIRKLFLVFYPHLFTFLSFLIAKCPLYEQCGAWKSSTPWFKLGSMSK